ncbi:unnamed protein product [Strongylus vulgaris]|uniref:Uncharacterized protein n=1 Tax=Strongylus vulgaris TaxID=40348 RepID=A0A3P7I5D4_STRVU|nr:unnamed protein product [Strongylus vulgaris]
MLIVTYLVIYDFYDEMFEFYQVIDEDLRIFRKYANDAQETMLLRTRMTEREVFKAIIRIKQAVDAHPPTETLINIANAFKNPCMNHLETKLKTIYTAENSTFLY